MSVARVASEVESIRDGIHNSVVPAFLRPFVVGRADSISDFESLDCAADVAAEVFPLSFPGKTVQEIHGKILQSLHNKNPR